MSKLILVKGCSATGKSTRALQLMRHLPGEVEETPLYARKGDYIFLGRFSKAGKWQGLDIITKQLGSAEYIAQYICDLTLSEECTVVVEGASLTLSWRWRPIHMETMFPHLDKVLMQYYLFEPHEHGEYHRRVLSRSGKLPSSDSMWAKNGGFAREYEKALAELEGVPYPDRYVIRKDNVHEPETHLIKIMEELGYV